MSLSEDQLQTLNNMVAQVHHLQEMVPCQVDAMNEQIVEIKSIVQQCETRSRELYDIINHMQKNLNAAPSTASANVNIRLPTPFAGKSSLCGTYFSQLALYFAGNPTYDTDEKKILLAISCLTGPPYNYMEPFLSKISAPAQEKPEVLTNYQLFTDTITNAYGDSDPTVRAEASLRRLHQTSSTTMYATEFRRLASLVEWNNAALVSQFKVNLRDIVQDELARRPTITNLEDLISEAIDIDNRLFQRQRIKQSTTPTIATPMEIDTTTTSGSRHSRNQVNQEERERRANDKACYYCGAKGHFSNNCPAKKSRGHISTILMDNSQEQDGPNPQGHHVNSLLSAITIPFEKTDEVTVIEDDLHAVKIKIKHHSNERINFPVRIGGTTPGSHALLQANIDTGACMNVISSKVATKLGLSIRQATGQNFIIANGTVVKSLGECTTKMRIVNCIHHSEPITFWVMETPVSDVILGMPWLFKHDITVQTKNKTSWINCDPSICCENEPIEPTELFPSTPSTPLPTYQEFSNEAEGFSFSPQVKGPSPITLSYPSYTKLNKTEFPWYTSSPNEINKLKNHSTHMPQVIAIVSSAKTSTNEDKEVQVPVKYQEFWKVFSKTEAAKLPPHRSYDHKIPLKDDTNVPYGPMYSMSKLELETLHDYIQENLAKGFIRRSESPAGAPVLFVKKKDGSLRLCIDYRGLNKITIASPTVLPLISETLDRLNQARIFSKLDMVGAYNLIRIAPGDEWKTAFICRYGHFEYTVMGFGLCSAPATFQAFVNDILRDHLDQFLVVYLDDILIFSNTQEEHDQHVRIVLQKLQNAHLSLKIEKCEFDVTRVSFLGFIVSTDGISMDPEKIKSIREWTPCRSVHDIQVFLGLTNFYRRFIKDYSKICHPLTSLLKKDAKFHWSSSAEAAFNTLKLAITSDPILRHYNDSLPCILETDASDYAIGAVCSQVSPDGLPHPIAFYSRKLLPAEQNYQVHDKELLAIIAAFKHWRPYLEFSRQATVVLTDHKNLEYFTTTRSLSRRQVRWAEILADYNFVIQYRPGKQNGAADALSRRDKPLIEGNEPRGKTPMILLDPSKVIINTVKSMPIEIESNEILTCIKQEIDQDTYFGPIVALIKKDPNGPNIPTKYSYQDHMLFHEGALCVPDNNHIKKLILEECHDSPAAGHFGIAKTYELVTRNYYWPTLRKYIKDYVSGCDTCIRNKNHHHKPYGLLSPLPIPDSPWTSVSVDFITQLPPSNTYTSICVFVDRFSKMALFVPTFDQIDAEGTVKLFITHVFSQYGLPNDIVSDRGVVFTSKFTQAMLKKLNVKQKLSTAFHPQTDGQTERVNSILEQYLRCFINYQQSDWDEYLPIAQFAYNNSKHSSTDTSPFYAVYGYHPRLSVALPLTTKNQTLADKRIEHIHHIHEEMRFHIATAQEKHAFFHNRNVIPSPTYNIGDNVWLSSKNIKTQRPAKKLDHKRLGPFKITAKIGSRSFKLALPHTMRIHPVFHVNLLEPFKKDKIQDRHPKELPPIVVNNHHEFEVEKIIDSRIHRNQLQYLVHWKEYNVMDRTWEPLKNLSH
jgi:hypothetical protein